MGRAREGNRRPHLARHRPPARLENRRRLRNPGQAPIFRKDVIAGLSLPQKAIPPKYFYDAAGSRLFERICRLAEYYPTRAELSLTRRNLEAIARFARHGADLIEYGSGEGVKSRLLIHAMQPAAYVPVDISAPALNAAAKRLARAFPLLRVTPVAGDFSRPLDLPPPQSRIGRTVYFPGSTIGNLTPGEARTFLRMTVKQAPRLLVGVDLKKDANVLHAAYNDDRGVTAAFNLNLLARINRELAGSFDLRSFRHYAFYNAPLGRIEMHLVSLKKQSVRIAGRRYGFASGESIHTENSYKYSVEEFQALAALAGYAAKRVWLDDKRLFALHGLEAM